VLAGMADSLAMLPFGSVGESLLQVWFVTEGTIDPNGSEIAQWS